jgi:hypothetical protein
LIGKLSVRQPQLFDASSTTVPQLGDDEAEALHGPGGEVPAVAVLSGQHVLETEQHQLFRRVARLAMAANWAMIDPA